MKKVFKKVTATTMAAYNGSRTCKDVVVVEVDLLTRVLQNQARSKLVFLFGLQQTYLDHSVRRSLMKQTKALDVEVQYVDQGHVSEKVTASVEQLAKLNRMPGNHHL